MIVCLLDRILKLLDKHPDRSAVVATCLDWAAAFDRQDPTIAVNKFIELRCQALSDTNSDKLSFKQKHESQVQW